jgi:hypothetical protein
LADALLYLRRADASNPKDKVYAAFGLCRPKDCPEVNYNLTVENVFTSVVVKHIDNYNNLKILNFCRYPPVIKSLPSRVLDWTDQGFYRALKVDGLNLGNLDDSSLRRYNAGGLPIVRPYTSIQISDDNRCLHLAGFIFDRIQFVADIKLTPNMVTLCSRDALDLRRRNFGEDLSELLDLLPTRYLTWLRQWAILNPNTTFNSPRAVFRKILRYRRGRLKWKVVFGCRRKFGRNSDAKQFKRFMYWPTSETLFKAYMRTLRGDMMALLDYKSATVRSRQANLDRAVPDLNLSMRTFATSSTHVFLLVPEEARVGDHIAFIRGEEYPYVLRPMEEHYVLIGECYVHGFMDGEILPVAKALVGSWYDIEIR